MNHNAKTSGIRKAAIFVSSLARNAADRVLEQMDPQQAQLVRQAMVEMEAIDPGEQQRVLEEFCRLGPLVPEKCPPGIELDDRLARKFVRPAAAGLGLESEKGSAKVPPFRFLRDAEADKLGKILSAERPQVIALVLSHLPPEQAGNVLVRLAPATQVDVIRRLVDLEEADPEVLREVEHGLETRLSEQFRMQRRRVAGISAIAGILEASEQRVGMQILENLSTHDRHMAERLSPEPMEFEELLRLGGRALEAIVAAAEPELVVLALVGAPPAWIERFLQHFPESEARAIRYRLDHFGPIRLRDVETARSELAELARRLAVQGRLEMPRRRPTAAAA